MVCSASLRLSTADSISSSTILMDRPSGILQVELIARTYSGTEGAIIARVDVVNSDWAWKSVQDSPFK